MAHVVVVGAGIAGLTAGYFAVKAGHRVTVVESAAVAGGAVQPLDIELPEGTLTIDAGAEAYAARSTLIDQLLDELGLAEDIVTPHPAGSWLYLPKTGAVPAPRLGMWGIPGDPQAPEVVTALGPEAAARAAQELQRPITPWAAQRADGQPVTIGALVADRFGPPVVEHLVAPVVSGVHSADPYDLDIDQIAPGLLDKAIELGSVAKAITHIRSAAPPGAAVKTLRGGLHRLVSALVTYLENHAQLRCNTTVTALDANTKTVSTTDGPLSADQVVLAVDAPTAFDLIAPLGQLPAAGRPQLGAGVALVVLVIDEAALDAQPRGTGMLVSPAVKTVGAKAATHVTAKWPWAQDQAQDQRRHRHVLRLSYGRLTDPDDGATPGFATPDGQLIAVAHNDAAELFGVSSRQLTEHTVVSHVVRWREQMPLVTPENTQRLAALREVVDQTDWLDVTGAWFAGTGLAAITQQSSAMKFYPLQ